MNTPPSSSDSSTVKPQFPPPQAGEGRREARGLMWFVGVAVVLCMGTVIGFNMIVVKNLYAPFGTLDKPATETVSAGAVHTQASASASGAVDKTSPASTNKALPPTPEAAATDMTPMAPASEPAIGGQKADRVLSSAAFAPPDERKMPEGPMGDVIRKGEQIFLRTGVNAPGFVGNSLNCASCHLDAGRLAKSAPLWGAYPLYPAYRSKTKHVDTFSERLRGCFMFSMNGKAPEHGDDVLVALEAYAYWMAQGAPVGTQLPGAGYGKVDKPAQKPDFVRGQAVFEAQCVLCHGADGQGQRSSNTQVFPPLWGANSYNWGAGMHDVEKAAAFIQANMPLGKGSTLTAQEAWDVSTYINSHERPQDPRFTGDVATTRKQFHDSPNSLYGTQVNGKLLGTGTH